MAHKFHKLSTESAFPNIDNVEVYKFDNDFDYSRYDYTQMELMICSVPWDMGEAHVGNRTVSGIGNVVYFGTKEARDTWFDAIPDAECYRFTTKFKELHRDLAIDVPIPYDMCAKHNYLKVHYAMFANDDSPVMLEGDDGLRDWFWFIREVEFVAPNTTRLHLLDDAFQTWIYDVDVTGMVLERGHAPMFETKADAYLQNPLANNSNLLTEDVNFGTISQVKHIDVLELNAGNMYACIATTANPLLAWGTKAANTWKTPASAHYTRNGNPSVGVFAVAVADLNGFLSAVTADYPQFKQTVQGVFFASADLLDIGTSFTFANTTCYQVGSSRKRLDFVELGKAQFGYETRYSDIAKLYTSPYAHIEICDENGEVDTVLIEDTDGTIEVSAMLSLSYPFVSIDAHLLGVGGNATATVTYKNVNAHTFPVSGQWYETLRSWEVPTFAVVLDASDEYDYSTHFDRIQRENEYNTAYSDTIETATATKLDRQATATTNETNANLSATANRANENENADTLEDNADLVQAANTATTTRSNTSAVTASGRTQSYNTAITAGDNILIDASASSTIAANEQQASLAAASGMANSIIGAAGSAVSGDPIGAVAGIASGSIGAATTLTSSSIANGLTATNAVYAQTANSIHSGRANDKTADDTTNHTSTATDLTTIKNDLTDGTAANSAATMKANATRTYTAETTAAANTESTESSNATRDYNAASANATRDKTLAQNAVTNDTKQAALRAPFVYGSFSNGESSATKPIALFANIVTQSKGAISAAGDEMLRYGYTLDKYWNFDGNWNVGRYFTYWKLRDFWVSNLNVPDMYMDKLRFFLFGGVTIWRNPEDIGKRTIYENFNG